MMDASVINKPVDAPDAPTREILIDRARRLAPVLRERAARCEDMRRAPEETVADYVEAGLIRATQPRRHGGVEMGWDTLCEISQILAAACGSQAWIQRIMADHAQMLSTFPAEAQDDVWGKNQNALISASFDPQGRATRVEGGFLFSGRHAFSSGVDHAHWMICGGYIIEGDRKDGPHFFLVPKQDATIIDDWKTMGLAGTGSKSFVVDKVFIPAHRFLEGKASQNGEGPGTKVNTSWVYRIPRGSGITTSGFAALTLGMAQGVQHEFLSFMAKRTSRGLNIAAQPTMQELVARSSGEIVAAEALYKSTLSEMLRRVELGEKISQRDRAITKRNVCLAARLCFDAGTRMFNAAGGRALYLDEHLQRQYRNLVASASHHGLVWESAAVDCGAALLRDYGADIPPTVKH